jgi:exodeoxyribonuclease VII large subunit
MQGVARFGRQAYRNMNDVTETPTGDNAPPFSVSELAQALKRTVEERFGYVRLRGEISKVTRHASGHVYLTLKDENASIDGVVWRGAVSKLACQPEQGLEVIVTGKITTYPQRSSYQIVLETMEPAGVGALLAQLERLKTQMRGEGLFNPARKKPIPTVPAVIGVITSPTGAVIRDILHRIRDRWPCRVIVWPCVVQGEQASKQVAAAVRGFAAMAPGGAIPRPDVLIVARGGGSIEDLWAFNDEALARAVADCPLPVISAVGHETDTTLIDFVSDRRAPTPTAAAEMATPVLTELKATVADFERRMQRCAGRSVEVRRTALLAAGARLPSMADLFGRREQRLDQASARLASGLTANVSLHREALLRVSARLSPGALRRPIARQQELLQALDRRGQQAVRTLLRSRGDRLASLGARLPSMERPVRQALARLDELGQRARRALARSQQGQDDRLTRLGRLLASLNPDSPLERGFARVHHADGRLVRQAAELASGEGVSLHFRDGARDAVIEGEPTPARPKPAPKPKPPTAGQGDLF